MHGAVWHYNERSQDGYIIGRDKQRYSFSRADYRHAKDPTIGAMVEFQVEGETAKEIMVITSASKNM